MSEVSFSRRAAADAQTALRKALGLPAEQFPVRAFIGMISDEIEQLRHQGEDDSAIARLVVQATGKAITAEMITQFYASPHDRGRPGSN
jgi:hypothetical protein